MSELRPTVTASIVTFNHEASIGGTLRSLIAHRGGAYDLRIRVLDNGSTDGTPEIVAAFVKRHPEVVWEKLPQNVGFGRAHNRAIREADSDFFLVCNPDVYFEPDVVGRLLDFLNEHPEAALCTPKVLNPDGTVQGLNKRNPNVFDLVVRRLARGRLLNLFHGRIARYEMRDVGYEQVVSVPFISGCFMFCRTQALKEIGGFDERYFLYFEDADLTRRFREAGYETLYCPEAVLYHLWRRDAHSSKRLSWVMAKSAFAYFRRWGWRFV